MPTVFKTTKGYALTKEADNKSIDVSGQLYRFIKDQKQPLVTFDTIAKNYRPIRLKLTMVDDLPPLADIVKRYNKLAVAFNDEHPNTDPYPLLSEDDGFFEPYFPIFQDSDKLTVVEEDTATDFTGYVLSNLKTIPLINGGTSWVIHSHWPAYFLAGGAADNATQVQKYLNKSIMHYLTKDADDDLFQTGRRLCEYTASHKGTHWLVRMTPIKNTRGNSQHAYRWSDLNYIGAYQPQHDRFSEEENIDYLFEWQVYPLNRKEA